MAIKQAILKTGWQTNDFEAFREITRNLYDAEMVDPRRRIEAQGSMTATANLRFHETTLDGVRLTRTTRHRGKDDPDYIWLRMFKSGQSRHVVGEQCFVSRAGRISLGDYSRNMSVMPEACHQIGVSIPHAAIGFDPGRHPPHLHFEPASAVGRVLQHALQTHYDEAPNVSPLEAQVFADGFCGLLGGLLAGGINSVTDRQIAVSRAEAMRDYIERHLPDPQLGFDALAQAFHASRATIFRDFAEDGGVSHYIRRRRLERAFADLARSEGHRGLIADVARTWGFASVHTFSRQFREAFGIGPSDVVACRAPPPPQR